MEWFVESEGGGVFGADMQLILNWIAGVVLGLSLCGAGYALACAFLAGRFMRARANAAVALPPVTILKPLHSEEPELEASLESFCRQIYPAPVQLVFGVHDGNDPARAVAERLMAKYPQLDATIVADNRIYGSNRKVSNLINMLPAAKHGALVLSDSDINVSSDWLTQVMTALEQKGVGIVTCLYTGKPVAASGASRLWPVLAAMGTSYDFLPNVIFGTSSGLAAPCFGSTIALKRTVLDEIGGFDRFANLLADDYELGRAVREKGYELAIPPLKVEHNSTEASFGELFRHELRWTRTTRLVNPGGHFGSGVTFTVPLALIGLALSGLNPFAWIALGMSLLSRQVLKASLDRVLGINTGPAWILPLRDMISFAVFVTSLFGETVHWRGERFEVEPSGAMSQS